jgi:hypothetical protein
MGELLERAKLSLLVNGNGIAENFKNNSLWFYEQYQKSSDEVKNINLKDLYPGGFYFLHYKDSSNWMKYSPIFVVDFKKFSNKIIIFGVNLNFIPMEVRVLIFDKFIKNEDFDNNNTLAVTFQGMYNELRTLGFEYAIMEFDALNIEIIHRIHLNKLARFLYHQHPKATYDPKKLVEIWKAKIGTRDQRHKEMMVALVEEFYDVNFDIDEKYKVLKNHIDRIRSNQIKYGNKLK